MRRNTRQDPRPNPRRQLVPTRGFRASFTGFRGCFPRPVGGGRPRRRGRAGRGAGSLPAARRRPRASPSPPPPPRSRSLSPPRSRFRPPAPPPPGPRGEPKGYGPSCFFPAHAAGVLLAPAAAAVLTLLTPAFASAAAPSVSGVAGRGVERAVDWAGVAGRSEAVGIAGRDEGVGRHAEGAAPSAPAAPPDKDRSWPVGGPAGAQPTVVRGWEPPPSPWAAGHRGVDLAAPAGAVVRAAAPGRVAYAGTVAGRGVLTLEVSRSGRPPLRTTYEPVRSTARKGQRIKAGQPVAVLQHGGPFHCREPCLHWGLRRGKTYLDPLSLLPRSMLRGGPSRLLPIFGVPVPAGAPTTPRQPASAEPTPQARSSAPTAVALLEATGLAAVAIWAFGRLPAARPAATRRARIGDGVGDARGVSSGEGVGERGTQ
ncbi:murein hydrolase activator EnvC family protein [Streptomyces platensis]|uniref:murein hydrolase activator EnvC family protein n=1 Tax=Streptomyces platensis TaxID=58346 RepID=UPI0037942B86